MTYKDQVIESMNYLAAQSDTVFIGQGLINGERVYGTLKDVPTVKCLEMPIAENLIVGTALGLSLRKYRPIVVFQRMDFMLICADAIINHMNLMPQMTNGLVKFPVMLRCIVGSQDKKFDVGMQHSKDLAAMFQVAGVNVVEFRRGIEILNAYKQEYNDPSERGVIMVEYKDNYEKEIHGELAKA